MRVNSLVVATAHINGIITLEGIDRNEVKIVGASVGSLPGDNQASNTFSFSIKKGEKGMVALVVIQKYGTRKNSDSESYQYLLGVKWEEGQEKPHIDLQSQWVPEDPTRLGCYYYDNLEVVIDGITYSGSPYASEKEGKRQVKDANLLCQYMDSKISAAYFRETIGLPAKEQSAREEVVLLRLRVQELEEKNQIQEAWHETQQQVSYGSLEVLQQQLKNASEMIANAAGEDFAPLLKILPGNDPGAAFVYYRTAAQRSLNVLQEGWLAGQRLKAAVEKQWFKRKTVFLALNSFPAE
jgi:FtsZ-binding cell division protein ZapB